MIVLFSMILDDHWVASCSSCCCCSDSLMSRALDTRRCRTCSSSSTPGGCFPVRSLYIHHSTASPATPSPPDARKPAASSRTTIAAGTSTGLKIISSGVATASAMTVHASVSPDSTSNDIPATAATTAFTTTCCCSPCR
ncbi:unnamed protein product [Musa acuminata subsp. burmannicoides]